MPSSRRAQALRRSATATERKLWSILRNRRLDGLKVRRQVPLGPYVIDFLCLRHRLVVEADGPFHDPDRDAVRDAWLAGQGFRVLRLTNREIDATDQALGRILRAIQSLSACGRRRQRS